MFDIAPLSWQGIGCTLLVSAIIGVERQVKGKPIGIRTASLICLGTYIFLVMARSVLHEQNGDPSRVIGQVITGIGFLGAGVILSRDGIVLGVTSAAAIWVLAALGVMIGLEHYTGAIIVALVVVGILIGVDILEEYFHALRRGVHRHIISRFGGDDERGGQG